MVFFQQHDLPFCLVKELYWRCRKEKVVLIFKMAGRAGFEPALVAPKATVLPLDDLPISVEQVAK